MRARYSIIRLYSDNDEGPRLRCVAVSDNAGALPTDLKAEELFYEFQDYFAKYSVKMAELQKPGHEILDLVGFRRKSAWEE
jgi:hypothetical protein